MSMKYNFPHDTKYWIETGCFWGAGIIKALESGFENIISIELSDHYAGICEKRFIATPQVKIVRGDSGLILGDVIKPIQEPITFWLDGHWSKGDTALGCAVYPLLEELTHIKNHPVKNHVIYIDDVRLWKEYNESLNLNSVIALIQSINPNYSFFYTDGAHEGTEFPDDILVAKVE